MLFCDSSFYVFILLVDHIILVLLGRDSAGGIIPSFMCNKKNTYYEVENRGIVEGFWCLPLEPMLDCIPCADITFEALTYYYLLLLLLLLLLEVAEFLPQRDLLES
jgi:hypothetical protein